MKSISISHILLIVALPLLGSLLEKQYRTNEVNACNSATIMPENPTLEKNKETVQKLFLEVFNTGRWELLDEIVAEEYAGIGSRKGPRALAEPIRELRQSFPDVQWRLEDVIAEGDRVAVRATWQGTHLSPFKKFAATHKQVSVSAVTIFQFYNSKIVQVWLQSDRLGFFQQIGVVSEDLSPTPLPPMWQTR